MFPFPFKNNVRKSKIRALKQEEYKPTSWYRAFIIIKTLRLMQDNDFNSAISGWPPF